MPYSVQRVPFHENQSWHHSGQRWAASTFLDPRYQTELSIPNLVAFQHENKYEGLFRDEKRIGVMPFRRSATTFQYITDSEQQYA